MLMPNPLVVIAAHSHPLCRRRSIKLDELGGERFIFRERGSGTRMATNAFFKEHQFQPQLRLELGNNEAIKGAVAGFPIHSYWYVVHPVGKRLSPIATVFREHLLSESVKWAPVVKIEISARQGADRGTAGCAILSLVEPPLIAGTPRRMSANKIAVDPARSLKCHKSVIRTS